VSGTSISLRKARAGGQSLRKQAHFLADCDVHPYFNDCFSYACFCSVGKLVDVVLAGSRDRAVSAWSITPLRDHNMITSVSEHNGCRAGAESMPMQFQTFDLTHELYAPPLSSCLLPSAGCCFA